MPVFAILLAIGEDDLESFLSVLLEDILAVAIHLAKLVFIWLLVIEPGDINVVSRLSLAIASDHANEVLLDGLEVVESPETDEEGRKDDHVGLHVLVASLCERYTKILPNNGLWINDLANSWESFLEELLSPEEPIEAAAVCDEVPLEPADLKGLNASLFTLH